MVFPSQNESSPVSAILAANGIDAAHLSAGLLNLADEVSHLLLDYYAHPEKLTASRKADNSPITAADSAAHRLICDSLRELTPAIPILSEESSSEDIMQRLEWRMVWVVDPLDGTREFIDRTDEFTCNVALVFEGRPVVGLISVPVKGCHYLGIVGVGARRFRLHDREDGAVLRTRSLNTADPLVLLASARHEAKRVAAMMSALEGLTGRVDRYNAGSAVKFCALLEGSADVYPRSSPCYEWDVAAGDALVHAAGGKLTRIDGSPMRYNSSETLLAPRFVAAADPRMDFGQRLTAALDLFASDRRS